MNTVTITETHTYTDSTNTIFINEIYRVDDALNPPKPPIAESQCGTTISMEVILDPGRYAVLVVLSNNVTVFGTVYVDVRMRIST